MNRQKMILAILLVLLVLAIIYSFARQPRPKRAKSLKYTPGVAAVSSRPTSNATGAVRADDKKLHLELLDKEFPHFSGFRRNIFKPIFHEEMKLPLATSSPSVRPTLPVPPPPPSPSLPPPLPQQIVEATPIQRDMARFTFLGFLKKDNKKTIFLSSDKEIYLVKKGDTIAGKYEVSNLTEEALTIHPLIDGGEIIIPLVENRALVAPRH
ncbi:hypothetical protein [Geotalea uraniireducens]|uniref:Type II secretion system protein PulP n=1 Tax=Geotalea uraniireducens (strain Rf4) TaxID=351605 RepID=A5GFB3_GEOUR|nr:hypothetical protein [Geotalea uraniireducens]ABQ26118.1 hypothetical protein Gura_1928 [Geotalea uraniireducens Rf4]